MNDRVRFSSASAPFPLAHTELPTTSYDAGQFSLLQRRTLPGLYHVARSLGSVTSAISAAGGFLFTRNDGVVDASTGVSHPVELCDLKFGRCAQLAGVGPRVKKLAYLKDVNVYSVGLYANMDSVRNLLGHHRGKPAEALMQDAAFLKDLKLPYVEKEIRMVITFRAVSPGTFWKALSERLGPLLETGPSKSALPKFKAHFKDVKFNRSTEVRLALSKDGTVSTIVDGKRRGVISSQALSNALVDVYMGSDPPSPSAKADMCRTVAALINARPADDDGTEYNEDD